MQVNRRKVFQACQSTGVDPSEHVRIANTLPAMLVALSITGSYDTSPESVRRAMDSTIDKNRHTDQYADGVVRVIEWLGENDELPEAAAPEVTEEEPAGVEEPVEEEPAEEKPKARKSRSRAKKA